MFHRAIRSAAGLAALLLAAVVVPGTAAQPEPSSTPAVVSGVVADSSGTTLPGAHVLLLGPGDALIGFALTGPDGTFKIERVADGAYRLRATFVGYESREVTVAVAGASVAVGKIRLDEAVSELGQLVVSGDRPPVVMRGDTLVYSASDYAVRKGAKVEDLLRKLPGVEVDADGTVRANGEVVRDVLVDGKEFFGGAPTVATQNLPADAVERVEVFEKQSEMAAFTGVDDGRGTTALNIALKEDRRSGLFGSATSGAGTATPYDGQVRYAGRTLVNRFSQATRLSVLGRTNNVNRAALSLREYLTLMPRPQADGSASASFHLSDALPLEERGWEGFSTTSLLGANGLYEAARGPEVTANYLGYHVRTERDGQATRDQLAAITAFQEQETADRTQTLAAHRVTLHADQDFGEGHDLQARAAVRWSSTRDDDREQTQRFVAADVLASTAASTSVLDTRGLQSDAALTYRRRLGSGPVVVAEAGGTYHETDETDHLVSNTQFLGLDIPAGEAISENYERDALDQSGWMDVRATQALGDRRQLQLRGEFWQRYQTLTQRAAETSPLSDPAGTAEVTHTRRRLGLDYSDHLGSLRLALGVHVERLGAHAPSLGNGGRGGHTRLLPSASLTYTLGQNRRVEMQYRTSTHEPEAAALQPFSSARGPFETYAGNPALRPEHLHDFDLRYIHFDAFTLRNVLALVRVSLAQRGFSSARTVDASFRQRVTPINVDQTWSAFAVASFGTPVSQLMGSVNLSARLHHRRTAEWLNGQENELAVTSGSVGVEYQNQTPEPVDIEAGVRVESRAASYSQVPEAGRAVSHLVPHGEIGWYPGRRLELRTSAEHRVRLAGMREERLLVPLWDVEAAVGVGPRTRLRLSVTDLLGRSRSIRYDETALYVEQRTTRTLGRYALLSLEHDF